jgi:hypothetical protein
MLWRANVPRAVAPVKGASAGNAPQLVLAQQGFSSTRSIAMPMRVSTLPPVRQGLLSPRIGSASRPIARREGLLHPVFCVPDSGASFWSDQESGRDLRPRSFYRRLIAGQDSAAMISRHGCLS